MGKFWNGIFENQFFWGIIVGTIPGIILFFLGKFWRIIMGWFIRPIKFEAKRVLLEGEKYICFTVEIKSSLKEDRIIGSIFLEDKEGKKSIHKYIETFLFVPSTGEKLYNILKLPLAIKKADYKTVNLVFEKSISTPYQIIFMDNTGKSNKIRV